jgi:hypothetical protein
MLALTPTVAIGGLLLMAVLIIGLRWTFGNGRDQLTPPAADPGDPTGDGLLQEAARAPSMPAAQVLRYRLAESGVRATIGAADGGAYRVLVFPDDLVAARIVLSGDALGD